MSDLEDVPVDSAVSSVVSDAEDPPMEDVVIEDSEEAQDENSEDSSAGEESDQEIDNSEDAEITQQSDNQDEEENEDDEKEGTQTNVEEEQQDMEEEDIYVPPTIPEGAQTANVKSTFSLVKDTLKSILENKDMKKHTNSQKSVERTVIRLEETLRQTNNDPKYLDSILIFEALRCCCRTNSSRIQLQALDCLSKLFSFKALDEGILVNPPDCQATNDQAQEDSKNGITPPPKQKLIDAAIDTISDCFQGEGTENKVELQIVRALSSCILSEDINSSCHGASLLKAVRTIYNIFIFSLSSSNQGIAQATLIQLVSSIFDKIDLDKLPPFENSSIIAQNISSEENTEAVGPKDVNIAEDITVHPQTLTLETMDKLNEDNESKGDDQASLDDYSSATDQELAVKDAFLVFRAMAKISAKPVESDLDMRSHAVRSKLLSLHIIHSIIKDHIDVFLSHSAYLPGKDGSTLVDAVRQYLCLSLARNAASPISPVFEITLEIMWLLISSLRAEFKREIPVFLIEIYFPISEFTTSTPHQKRYFLNVIQRLCNDPRTLIEFYLNYDCNPGMPNIMELMIDYLTKLALTRIDVTSTQRSYYQEQLNKPLATYDLSQLPLLSISNLSSTPDTTQSSAYFPLEYALKMTALNSIVSVLRSLSSWAHRAMKPVSTLLSSSSTRTNHSLSVSSSLHERKPSSIFNSNHSINSSTADGTGSPITQSQDVDDPTQFENLKQRKTELSEILRLFNSKPKKAIPELLKKGFIDNEAPKSIAKWIIETEGLDLAKVGDYLGEGDEKNIAVMHAFVDAFDFTGLSIVDGLRDFLQKFRLPGEGQKIDRFMLKFAERYVDQNPGVFSKADTAYVLCYSLIMLNTDLHSSQIKNRMTLQEFLENNEGIDNGNDLPKDFLVGLFNEIANDEIKLLSEQHQALISDDSNLVQQQQQQQSAFNFFSSRDLVREAYMQVSKEISSKTELAFKNLNKSKDINSFDVYYAASHVEHVKSVFENLWMSFLAALTPPFREYDDMETTNKCLDGLKISIKISSIFGIDDAKKSFIGALVQFCNLQNLEEIKIKNVNAIIVLLEEALSEGTFFKDSWKDVLLVVSQVERLQLISKGIDRDTLPDVAHARYTGHRNSLDSTRSAAAASIFDVWSKKATPMELAQEKHHNQKLSSEISKFISSSELVVLMDNIFTKSADLPGDAIVDFIRALTDVSLEEIESSQDASTPRMFSLQKMIDVCYYNMDRIKVEWTPIWAVMGKTFNKIATNANLAVVFFAIDSLRQLSMRFLDIEELSGFEFQHDFLKPFEYIIQNTGNTDVEEMIIECFRNFILTKSKKIKSGWKPILESLQYTSQSTTETIVLKTYLLVSNDIVNNNFESVFSQEEAFGELNNVFREISKNKRFQKLSLHALESLKKTTQKVAPICFIKKDDPEYKYKISLLRGKDVFQDIWFPMLFCFNDTIMTAEDLEVRSRALNYMFDSLVAYGGEFNDAFWEKICTKLLFPIFGVLSKHWEVNQFNSHDDLSVWLSTTLIQALRNLIGLFTYYFESLNLMLDGFLGLLISCICQENDTIARIGRSCLQQLILQNVTKFNNKHWDQIGEVFDRLFDLTTASELFDYDPLHQGRKKSVPHNQKPADIQNGSENGASEVDTNVEETVQRAHQEESSEDVGNEMLDSTECLAEKENPIETVPPQVFKSPKKTAANRSNEDLRNRLSIKNSIVVKCVLQLLMIEMLSELFENEEFVRCIPYKQGVKVTTLLEKSYDFARDFNEDYDLRTRLVEARVVDKIPNLLKQETSAAAVLINILFMQYLNDDEKKPELSSRLITISNAVVEGYVALDDRTMERSIKSWRPVIVEILQGYFEFDDDDFRKYCPAMYGLVIQILDKSVPSDLRQAVKLFLARVGELYLTTV